MSAQLSLPLTEQRILQHRENKRQKVEQFFWTNLGKKFESWRLHLPESQGGFGSAARSRISEVNRDTDSRVVIRNDVVTMADGTESSCYWAERRGTVPYLKCLIGEDR